MSTAATTGGFLTTAVVAQRLGVDPETVLAWIHSGALPAVNVARATGPGHKPRWRVSLGDLEAFLVARRALPAPPTPARARRRPVQRVTAYF